MRIPVSAGSIKGVDGLRHIRMETHKKVRAFRGKIGGLVMAIETTEKKAPRSMF